MRRIFVVGCPRSGTTLVQAMIARHPDVFSLRETCFLRAVLGDLELRWGDLGAHSDRQWYHRAGLARSSGRRLLRELEQRHFAHPWRKPAPRSWSACVKRYVKLLDAVASREGRSHWVEKTPDHLLYLDEIALHVPDAMFVHVLRDGLDVVASVADADMHYHQQTAGFRGGIVQWSKRWNRAMELHVARLGRPNNHALCLEDLIADPDGEWRRLRDFLDLDQNSDLLSRPGSVIADMESEPWKNAAFSGSTCSPHSKVTALFGTRSLTWLQEHLTNYEAIRDAVREQHRTISSDLERQGESPERGSTAVRSPRDANPPNAG